MKKTLSMIAAAACVATAIPATMAIPQTANAAVRVAVGVPGGGYYWGGRHYRSRAWRNGAWAYYDPIIVAPGYDYGYAAPAYGYNYGPSVGVYYDGGRRYNHRNYACHYNRYRGRVCNYRYW
jgi:hypothetical protein